MKNGFVNIQIIGKDYLKESFEDTYMQSGANSKGEFLKILLENYLNPDYSSVVQEVEAEKSQIVLTKENELKELLDRLNFYEGNKILNYLFEKHQGSQYAFRDRDGNKQSIQIDSVHDIFKIIMGTIKED